MLEVGTQFKLIPFVSVDYLGRDLKKPMPCTVIYVNEQHRFYTVEFTFPNGDKYKESFKF